MRTLLIDNYDSYTYNLFQVIAEVNGELPVVYYNDKITLEQISSMVQAGTVHSIVISPGPGTPTNSNDIGVCLDVLQQLPDVPILGICLGHQALALAHGASVVAAREPVHGRLSQLQHNGHSLFRDIPSGAGFEVVRYHSLLVDERSLPDCLEPVCWTTGGHTAVRLARDVRPGTVQGGALGSGDSGGPEERGVEQPDQQGQHQQQDSVPGTLLMGLAHRSRPHFGVQFHPESVATRFGIALLRNFRDLAAEHIQRRAGPAAAQMPPVRPVPDIIGPPGRLPALPPWPSPEHQRGPPLRLLWSRLDGLLPRLPGGSQGLFELLHGWAPDTFWLDSATADRGRFSYMGGRGGPLWRKLTYKLPPPTPASHKPQPPAEPLAPQAAEHSRAGEDGQGSLSHLDAGLQDHLQGPAGDFDSDAASSSSSSTAGGSSSSCGPASTACASSNATTAAQSGAIPPHLSRAPKLSQGTLTVETPDGRVMRVATPAGFLGYLDQVLGRQRLLVETEAAAQLPFNFWGGLVGYLGYELKAECGGANAHAASTPDAVMYLADRMVAVDHLTGDVFLLALYDSSAAGGGDGEGSSRVGCGCGTGSGAGMCAAGLGPASACADDRSASAGESVSTVAAAEQKALAQGWLQATQRTIEDAVKIERGVCSPSAGAAVTSWTQLTHAPSPHCQASGSARGDVAQATACGAAGTVGPCPPGAASTTGTAAREVCGQCLQVPEQQQTAAASAASAATTVVQACDSITSAASNGGRACGPGQAAQREAAPRPSSPVPFTLVHNRSEYLRNIAACHAALCAGESYEVCLTTALTRPEAPSPPQLYRTLRQLNPAPYAAWLQCGASGPTICCSSPERFLRGDRGGLLEARPIKGTAARVLSDPLADAAAAEELASSEKERAENLMIVDLLRNDLGRVSEVGTVHVPGLMDIESYATVHQMVSTVRGVRRAGISVVDCIRAAFPGGSMTGAPKVRTMQIIDTLEGRARGVYSGCIGFISLNDTFDLNIVIRTAVIEHLPTSLADVGDALHSGRAPGGTACPADGQSAAAHGGTLMTIGAGGAIVVQSQPEAEYEEMRLKARALLRAVGLCEGRDGPISVAS